MWKIFLALLLMTTPALAITNWTITIPSSTGESASNFPNENYSNLTILQTLLQNYRQGYYLTYNNATTLNVGAGEVSVWNGSSSLFLQNTGSQTATKSNLDTGSSFLNSTTYYVYCGTSSITAATCTVTISLNNVSPSGVTYYKQLGNFTTDSSGNISQIIDNSVPAHLAEGWVTKTSGSTYQAATDLLCYAQSNYTSGTVTAQIITDSSPTPTTSYTGQTTTNGVTNVMVPVTKGDYYIINAVNVAKCKQLGQ